MHRLAERRRVELAQQRDVVEDPERAAVRRREQVAVLNQQIVHRNDRQVQSQRLPVTAVVERNVDAGLGARVEQPATLRDPRESRA